MIDTLGIPGAQARVLLSCRRDLFERQLRARAYDLIVVSFGTNEVNEREQSIPQQWDRDAAQLLHELSRRGAKRFIWITLREPSLDLVTERSRRGYERAAWFFPYVNERIRRIAAQRDDVTVADWTAVSNIPNITGDLIHLNSAGIQLMTRTIVGAVRAQP